MALRSLPAGAGFKPPQRRHWLKTVVVSVEEKAYPCGTSGMNREGEYKRTIVKVSMANSKLSPKCSTLDRLVLAGCLPYSALP